MPKRRSFVILVVALVVVAAAVTFVISRGGDDEVGAASTTPSSGVSASAGTLTLQTACAEIAPDMALRVDALTRTAEAVRADVATMQAQGNTDGAEQATQVAVALENLAVAEKDQQGVSRATRELGDTLSSIC